MAANPEELIPDEQELPVTDYCVRALTPGPTLETRTGAKMPTLVGRLAVFDQWGEVNSRIEGRFMERLQTGAFAKTIRENRSALRVLFHHGEDPQIGFKPLGTISHLEETRSGVDYAVDLFDTGYNREILPALESGQFGSSFTFKATPDKRKVDHRPQRSNFNPEGIPEVIVHELRMREFGPCMFPVYTGTTAGTRSMTDEFVFARLARDPERLQQLLTTMSARPDTTADLALSNERAEGEPHSGAESRNVPLAPVRKRFETREGYLQWLNQRT